MSERERFFVNHGMIHDGLTGKHVELDEAAELLNVEPADIQRIAWGIVTKLGAMLKNMEAERDAAKAECEQLRVARAAAGQRVLELEGLLNTRAVATVGVLDVARGEHERLTAERDAANKRVLELEESIRKLHEVHTRDIAQLCAAKYDADTRAAELADKLRESPPRVAASVADLTLYKSETPAEVSEERDFSAAIDALRKGDGA